jgi:hypothetical protein
MPMFCGWRMRYFISSAHHIRFQSDEVLYFPVPLTVMRHEVPVQHQCIAVQHKQREQYSSRFSTRVRNVLFRSQTNKPFRSIRWQLPEPYN